MIELQNVCFSVKTQTGVKKILDNINLKINEGFIVFTGPNGGGKSTLAKIISGLYKVTSGKIILDGKDITNFSVTERAIEGISYAFQQPVRFKGLTVGDLISIALGTKQNIGEVCKCLSEVGLCAREYIDREIDNSLSGGELKRIEIAMAIARQTKLCIFDEPEAGIDLWSFDNLINVFEKLHNNANGNILIISHQQKILNIADRIIVVKNGKIDLDGSRDDVLPKLFPTEVCSKLMPNKGEVKNG